MFDVVTIGSVTRDVFFDVPKFQTIPWGKTPSKKAFLLPLGEKLEVHETFFTLGGNSANASVTFARSGFRVACIGKVGNDPGGHEIRRRLEGEKVNASMLKKTSRLGTAYSVLLSKDGERTILGYHGASNLFNKRDIDFGRLKARWWYVSLSGDSYTMFGAIVDNAKRHGAALAFNPSGYHLRHNGGGILRALKDISFLVLNEEEAALLTGIPFSREREVFRRLDKLTPGILAVTNGDRGVTVSDGKRVYRAGVFKENKLVDRTGAGDAFGSGFVAGLLRSKITRKNIHAVSEIHIREAIRFASANATSVVEHLGATEGTLTKKGFDASAKWKNLRIKVTDIS